MRKFFAVLTLAVSFAAAVGAANTLPPPECGDSCPWVR
jgi:hypothetical protein